MRQQPLADTPSSVRPGRIENAKAADSDDLICLYAFARSSHTQGMPAAEIEERLQLLRVGPVVALIAIRPIAEYCGDVGERNLSDAVWLAPRVRRHANLVNWTMKWSPVFPAPFGTLYKTFDSLTTFMTAHKRTIVGFLNDVADKEEWELRADAKLDTPELLDSLACAAWPDWSALSKGARYMRSCRDREALLAFGCTKAATVVRDHLVEIKPLIAAVRELAVRRQSNPEAGESIARYALLVDKANASKLHEYFRAKGASVPHVAITLSGPWPPFSFRPNLTARE